MVGCRIVLAILAWLAVALCASASAATIIDVGSHQVNLSDGFYDLPITANGTDDVTQFVLRAQIIDSPMLGSPPRFSEIIFDGAIWNEQPDDPPVVLDQLALASIGLDQGSIVAQGLLATLRINVSDATLGTYDLLLTGNDLGEDTQLVDPNGFVVDATIINGSVTVVPEPDALLLAMLGLLVAAFYGRRLLRRGPLCTR